MTDHAMGDWGDIWGPNGVELLEMVRRDPVARRCAGALMRHAIQRPVPTYVSEDVDSVMWLAYEATDLAHVVETYPDTVTDEVLSLLASTGWWDPDREGPDRALAVVRDVGI